MRNAASGLMIAATLAGGCTSQEDAEWWLGLLAAIPTGALVEDYDDYPGKSVTPRDRDADRRGGRGGGRAGPGATGGEVGTTVGGETGTPGDADG